MPAEPDLPPKDLLPKTGWKASAETAKALDGNPATFASAEKIPASFAVDCGKSVTMKGFEYVPRLDGVPEGLTVTPAFYVDFGNERMHMLRYEKRRPDGSSWGNGAMAVLCNAVFKRQV